MNISEVKAEAARSIEKHRGMIERIGERMTALVEDGDSKMTNHELVSTLFKEFMPELDEDEHGKAVIVAGNIAALMELYGKRQALAEILSKIKPWDLDDEQKN